MWRRNSASKPRRRKRGSSSDGCRASKPKSQGEFEEKFKRRVMTGYSSGSTEGREKYLDEWKTELQKKALEGDSRLEARERVKMGEEDAGSKRRTEWERIMERVPVSPFLRAAP